MKTIASTVSPLAIRANRYDLVSRIADDLAHELKNPLHAMVINLELLRRRLHAGAGDAALDRIAAVEQETRRIDALLEQLLGLLRPARLDARPMTADDALTAILPLLEVLARLHHVHLDVEPLRTPVYLHIRPDRFRHAFLNLVVRAFDAAGDAGGRLRIQVTAHDTVVCFRVAHAAVGRAAAAVGRTQSPTADAGDELDLAVAGALAAEMGGRLDVEQTGDDAGFDASLVLTLPRFGLSA